MDSGFLRIDDSFDKNIRGNSVYNSLVMGSNPGQLQLRLCCLSASFDRSI